MEKTLDLIAQVKEAMELMDANLIQLRKEEKDIHQEFLKVYHEIETMPKFNLYTAWLTLKNFQRVLQKRRIIKHELNLLNDNFARMKQLKDSVNISYSRASRSEQGNITYRENFFVTHDDILNRKEVV
jgi:hypothetical protein